MATDQTRTRLTEGLTGPLLELGLDLEAVDVTPAGRRRVVRVAIDRDGGVTLDDVAEATKLVSQHLDEGGPLSSVLGEQPYTLEVTSPGVDRPLTLPRHWRRNKGRLVKVTDRDGATVTGRVVGHDDAAAHLDVDGERRDLPYDAIADARVQIEFNRKEG
ncbi:ribosome maturation factor RimP [Nocardioides sp. HDW12B]|uniref:ribosome maturation factor RimP n=1 Tax=Nocardioides sp. HDW12B TaxID=2714939 RepID=UPI00140BC56B|nr:ribosome maturation factor RimP [Nocardioides sp. HDW12B]QIK66941.1 ribosome maturation factor RimP [Nocardioides sp. HDW12B]